jgi:hypothetical protein
MKGKKNMLLQKFSKHFTNSVNFPLQKFLKTIFAALRLCVRLNRILGVDFRFVFSIFCGGDRATIGR